MLSCFYLDNATIQVERNDWEQKTFEAVTRQTNHCGTGRTENADQRGFEGASHVEA